MAEPDVLIKPNNSQNTATPPAVPIYYIPHSVLKSNDENSPYFLVTPDEFRENVEYIKQKVVEVSQKPNAAFTQTEANEMLEKLERVVPIMSDQKQFLLDNKIINSEFEFESLKGTILDLYQRPSIKNIETFPQFRDNLKNLTETKTLQNGFERIEGVRQDRQAVKQQVAKQVQETAVDNKAEQSEQTQDNRTKVGLKADFSIPSNIVTGQKPQFTNKSTEAEQFNWIITKDGQEVKRFNNTRELNDFEFNEPGNYYVSLNVSDGEDFDTITKLVTVAPVSAIPSITNSTTSAGSDTTALQTDQLDPATQPAAAVAPTPVAQPQISTANTNLTIPAQQPANPQISSSGLLPVDKNRILTPSEFNRSQQEATLQQHTPSGLVLTPAQDRRRQQEELLAANSKLINPVQQPQVSSTGLLEADKNKVLTPSQFNRSQQEATLQKQNLDNTILIPTGPAVTVQPASVPVVTPVQVTQPVAPTTGIPTQPSIVSRIFNTQQSNKEETLKDLATLSPLGRRAIWGTLNQDQRQYLTDHPFRDWMQEKFDERLGGKDIANKVFEGTKKISGYSFLRDGIKTAYNGFKENRRQKMFEAAENGNSVAAWTKKKYLEYKRNKNNKQSLFKLAGFLGKELLKSILSPITNTYNFVMDTKVVSSIIRTIQGVNNFAGKTLSTIGRVGGGLGAGLRYALLPTIVSSLMGVNPLLAAGIFSSFGLATQAFKGIDLLSKPAGFKLPFIDGALRRARVFNELNLNPQKYVNQDLAKFPKGYKELVNEFRTTPELAKAGRLFSIGKHLLRSIPMGVTGAGLGFLLTGSLPLALAIGGGTMIARAGIGVAAERISMLMGKGLTSFPLFRHIFKFPGMSFLDAADGANWIRSQADFIQEKGWGDWFNKQGDSIIKLGPVNVTEGMSSTFMLAKTGVAATNIVKFFTTMPSAFAGAGAQAGSFLSKIPIISRIAAPVIVLGYLGAVAAGLATFSWGTLLGVIFGAVAGSLTFALFSSTIIGALVGIPAAAIVGHYANKFGQWVGGFFDKTAEVLNDMNIVSLIPIIQLGKAIYDIINSTIEDLSDYARLGLIVLSIIPALGILVQLSENQASANFEKGNKTVVTANIETLNYEAQNQTSYTLDKFEYDCETSNQQIFTTEIEFLTLDIIALNSNNTNTYNLKGQTEKGIILTYKNMDNINPVIKINQMVGVGEVVGSCMK